MMRPQGMKGFLFLEKFLFLKFLFGLSSFSTAKSELLVFLTPKNHRHTPLTFF